MQNVFLLLLKNQLDHILKNNLQDLPFVGNNNCRWLEHHGHNKWNQLPQFLTQQPTKEKHCNFKSLKEKLIEDCIVIENIGIWLNYQMKINEYLHQHTES